jgi:hypothetical protein
MPSLEATIYIPSNKPDWDGYDKPSARRVAESLHPLPTVWLNGIGAPSFAKLINTCAQHCPTEIVIICNDKSRPKPSDVERMLALIADGFGIVGLYRFGFFGFRKEVFRRIGPFDERYIKGGFEDDDMHRKSAEANIAIYEREEIEYWENWKSRWDSTRAQIHFQNKWREISQVLNHYRNNGRLLNPRMLPEERYDYDFGPAQPDVKFRYWADSVMMPGRMKWKQAMCDWHLLKNLSPIASM